MLNKSLNSILKGFTKTIEELEEYAAKRYAETAKGHDEISKLNDRVEAIRVSNSTKCEEARKANQTALRLKSLLEG